MVKQLLSYDTEIGITVFNQIPLVELPRYLDIDASIALDRAFKRLLRTYASRVIFDFNQTSFIDSCGIGTLTKIFKLATEKKIEIVLWSVHPRIHKILSLAGLSSVVIVDPKTKYVPIEDCQYPKNGLITYHPSIKSLLKRMIDIIGALVGLMITAIVFFPIAIAIKIDSPGPIFFSQTRCGWLGKPFRIWKFRSMVIDAEELKPFVKNQIEGPLFKNKNDPRITRVGQFLRRTSLDELPQFWNVLKGEMSLVGTRPPTIDEVAQYTIPMWQRLNVKPGITGEWQINGRSTLNSFDEVLELDLYYQKFWSPLYDLKLVFKTLWVVINKNSGAF